MRRTRWWRERRRARWRGRRSRARELAAADRDDTLAGDLERTYLRGQHGQAGIRPEQLDHELREALHLVAVVQDQQDVSTVGQPPQCLRGRRGVLGRPAHGRDEVSAASRMSVTEARGTWTTAASRCRARRATSAASRDLPTPTGPVTDTRRTRRVGEQRVHGGQLGVATDQRSRTRDGPRTEVARRVGHLSPFPPVRQPRRHRCSR